MIIGQIAGGRKLELISAVVLSVEREIQAFAEEVVPKFRQ